MQPTATTKFLELIRELRAEDRDCIRMAMLRLMSAAASYRAHAESTEAQIICDILKLDISATADAIDRHMGGR